ncbi:MarR family transcriptional regulator [Sphingomonas ginsenosidivorax]|uniref:MarR family transcriptional regulator n=1 Tax=Sphingomonas ginsenosidivorax TaxID=862135 RepID=A0A5C6U769_9SPHN|nr:MarR family transcriptional regulator [Sphingomonas ginsenosidivorax]TXC67971.1 MarR family transcriptional regulator [Sphingomonas ginsenosidivorax]
MATTFEGDELIDVVVRLPRKAIEDTLLTARASNPESEERRHLAAKAILAGRRRRAKKFAGVRFYDPSWDMILELYVATIEQRALAVSELCSLSGGSTTTALRHIENIEALRYISRGPDPDDRRRLIVTMLPLLEDSLNQWLDLQIVAEQLGL